jgi:CheY-like chemotaxis protein
MMSVADPSSLHRHQVLQQTPQGTRALIHGPRTDPFGARGPTLLIVEDDASIARALVRLLTRDGYQVDAATNGQEALAACARQEYPLILCDLWMPILDGQGFYQALYHCQPHLCERVVFLTGDVLTPTIQAFLAYTRAPLLIKPFTAACLRALLMARCPKALPV